MTNHTNTTDTITFTLINGLNEYESYGLLRDYTDDDLNVDQYINHLYKSFDQLRVNVNVGIDDLNDKINRIKLLTDLIELHLPDIKIKSNTDDDDLYYILRLILPNLRDILANI